MPFARNSSFAGEIGDTFGEYESTFTSDSGQVRAELFRREDKLIAYVSFAGGLKIQQVTDSYVSALERHALESGYAGKLRITYTEN